jgi:adenylate cyclase
MLLPERQTHHSFDFVTSQGANFPNMATSRQLAAIMFTDIVGYTAIMGKDEEKALAVLRKNLQIQGPLIEKYNGELLKEIGDGILASFPSVSDAVYCAGAIQDACTRYSDINLRIGIHVGEVVFEGKDVFGDGVNIASRIVDLTPTGGIWISESGHKNVRNKKGIQTNFVQEAQLKNVAEPMRIYEVKVDTIVGPILGLSQDNLPTRSKPATSARVFIGILAIVLLGVSGIAYLFKSVIADSDVDERSIAVMPFKNNSSEDDQYFSDGFMDALVSHLCQISELRVISRTTMEQYRSTTKAIPKIAEELHVTHVLEGSVQRVEDDVRIIVKLIDGRTDRSLWSHTFDRKIVEIFKIQSEISKKIGEELRAKISPREARVLEEVPTESMGAYDLFLKGRFHQFIFFTERSLKDWDLAQQYFKTASEIDPSFLLPKVSIGWNYFLIAAVLEQNPYYLDSAIIIGDKLLIEYPDRSEVLSLVGAASWFKGVDLERSEGMIIEAIQINPNDPISCLAMAAVMSRKRRYDYALVLVDRAISLDPFTSLFHAEKGNYWLNLMKYSESEASLLKAIDLDPNNIRAYRTLSYCHVGNHDLATALKVLDQALQENSDNLQLLHLKAELLSWNAEFDQSEKLFRKLKMEGHLWSPHRYAYTLWNLGKQDTAKGLFIDHREWLLSHPETSGTFYNLAGIQSFLNELDAAFTWLNRIQENSVVWGPPYHLLADPLFDNLKGDRRLQDYISSYLPVSMEEQADHYEEMNRLPFLEFVQYLEKQLH